MGFLVALILFVTLATLGPFFNRPDMAEYKVYADAAIFFTSAILTLLLGLYLRRKKGKVFIDPESGDLVEIKPRHTLFFIPVLFWPLIFAGFGVKFLFFTPKKPMGALIRSQVYYCFSEDHMDKAIDEIAATKNPVNYDRLQSDAEKNERRELLERQKDCGVVKESAFPMRFESDTLLEVGFEGRTWRIAQVRLKEMEGERLEKPFRVWFFRRYDNERDAFIRFDDGKTW
jgi:hypothetical protein